MQAYRQRMPVVYAEQVTETNRPKGMRQASNTFNNQVVGYVDIRGWSHPVWQGDWLIYNASEQLVAVSHDPDFVDQFEAVA